MVWCNVVYLCMSVATLTQKTGSPGCAPKPKIRRAGDSARAVITRNTIRYIVASSLITLLPVAVPVHVVLTFMTMTIRADGPGQEQHPGKAPHSLGR